MRCLPQHVSAQLVACNDPDSVCQAPTDALGENQDNKEHYVSDPACQMISHGYAYGER